MQRTLPPYSLISIKLLTHSKWSPTFILMCAHHKEACSRNFMQKARGRAPLEILHGVHAPSPLIPISGSTIDPYPDAPCMDLGQALFF